MPALRHQGVTLHYQDVGKGPAVLLLHAFALSSDSFWPQLEALGNEVRMIAPDHRGFGQSSVSAGLTSMDVIATDALALLDVLAIKSAVVVGVSMGGYAAMSLVRLDPARVKGLVLVGTHASPDDPEAKAQREQTALKVEAEGMQVLVDSMLPRLLSAHPAPSLRARVERAMFANPVEGAASALRGMAVRGDSREILSRFAGPALVVRGEEDVITPLAKAQELVGLLAGATFLALPGAGHLAHLEENGILNSRIVQLAAGG